METAKCKPCAFLQVVYNNIVKKEKMGGFTLHRNGHGSCVIIDMQELDE